MSKTRAYLTCHPAYAEQASQMRFENKTGMLLYLKSYGRYEGRVCFEFELDGDFEQLTPREIVVSPEILNRAPRRMLTEAEFIAICYGGPNWRPPGEPESPLSDD